MDDIHTHPAFPAFEAALAERGMSLSPWPGVPNGFKIAMTGASEVGQWHSEVILVDDGGGLQVFLNTWGESFETDAHIIATGERPK